MSVLSYRSLALWMLGYPEAALADTEHALKDAREVGQAATLMYALDVILITHVYSGNYAAANAQLDEVIALAGEKGTLFWKAFGMICQGWVLALTGKASFAIQMITSGITAFRSTGATAWMPFHLSHLTSAYADVGDFDDARCCIGEAVTTIETSKERWFEAEVHRTAGEIALIAPEPDAAKAEAYFDHALAVARAQQAKSWELRGSDELSAALARSRQADEARNLLAPVYGWFTEGFDTLDLKEAKALLETLS